MRFWRDLLAEYRAIFTNRVVVLVVVVGSMVYGLLYPMPYLNDVVSEQKLLIVDEDKSTLSKELIFLVGSTPQIELVAEVPSLKEAQESIESFQADGVLFIPQGFESSAYLGVGSVVSYMGNASYFLIYGAIVEGIHDAIDALSQKLHKLHHPNALSTFSISYEAIPLYNPSLGYINYALAAVLVFILHQTLIGGSAILTAYQNRLAKESKREGLCEAKGALDSRSYSRIARIVLVRICAFSSVYCVWFLVYFGVLFPYFGVHIHASMGDFWRFVIWPSELLPSFLRELAYVIPAYHGIRGFVSLNQMGAEFGDVMGHIWALLGIGVFCVAMSIVVLARRAGH